MKPITIVGGGLAGLALGIGLRRADIPVTIWEAGSYPRHKVCGEFLSGRGVVLLQQLGVNLAGARRAKTIRFVRGGEVSAVRSLPEPALCLSRWRLDAVLAEEFRRWGGELRERQRGPTGPLGEGFVRATGRRVEPDHSGWRWIGLKAHVRGVRLAADLELHLTGHEYIGLCRLDDDLVNVCGLFWRRGAEPGLRERWRELLRGPAGSRLAEQMRDAEFDERSCCAVGGLSFALRGRAARSEVSLGDAWAMIPPFTGNGMSLALESAALAQSRLIAYARGDVSWDETRRLVTAGAERAFAWRLRWAVLFQRLLMGGHAQRIVGAWVLHTDEAWRWLFARTR